MTHTPPSWSADLRGTAPDPRDRLLWNLAWYTYGAHLPYGTTPWDPATQPDLPTGWHRIDDDELASAGYSTATFRNHESGLRCEVFARGQGPMVLAFCGTNDRRDWVSNTDQAPAAARPSTPRRSTSPSRDIGASARTSPLPVIPSAAGWPRRQLWPPG